MKNSNNWFAVDKNGLRKLIEQRGHGPLIAELVQNALDEDVTTVTINLSLLRGRPLAELSVEDDSPEGFRNLAHAFTLFAESAKKDQPEKRGRFNLGEKFVLAVCQDATIATTTGTVVFDASGRRRVHPRQQRERGSVFTARLKMTRNEYDNTIAYLQTLLLPVGVTVTLNGSVLTPRTPIHTFEASLDTELADEEGFMRRRVRKTNIELYEPLADEVASLYELGLPVVETGDKFHINIGQKVPLGMSRDNVPPKYLKTIRTLILNEMHDRLTPDDMTEPWVKEAAGDNHCSDAAITAVLDKRFGTDRVSYDPSDVEAVNKAVANGCAVVLPRSLSKGEWENARRAKAIQPAGRLFPTPKPYSDDPNAPPVTVIPETAWTAGMKRIVHYAEFLAQELMDVRLSVRIVDTRNSFSACYGKGKHALDFNLCRLGRAWFENGIGEDVDGLLIHEFGHEYEENHLCEDYYEALCQLGAKLKRVALEKHHLFTEFVVPPSSGQNGSAAEVGLEASVQS